MTTDKARAEAAPPITTERAVLIVLTEADELRDTVEIIEQTNEKMGYRASSVQRMALEETKRRERDLRQVADALTARDAEAAAKLARVEANVARWQHEAEGLREAVRVLAEELIVARGYGLCIKGHETDRIAVTQRNTDANPIAKAALDAAGGAQ